MPSIIPLTMRFRRIRSYASRHVWIVKATITSWISACVDFGISFVSFAVLGFGSGTSAALGAIGGGITNCAFNYHWTFRASGSAPVCVGVKYILVWTGSLLLNTYGTEFLTHALLSSDFLDNLGMSRNVRFTIARLLVALSVSLLWNLRLQRQFVFRRVTADSVIMRILGGISSLLRIRRRL